jgi:uncharacterized protein YndB with AHSA1/START domain
MPSNSILSDREIRTDSASRLIPASPMSIYDAFIDPSRLVQWLPPANMTGRVIEYDARKGGRYRIELTYKDGGKGKTTDRTDVASGTFVELEPGRRIIWSADFESDDPAFAGTMIMTWSLEARVGGTQVTITADHVPPGIGKVEHDEGLNSTLANLAAFVQQHGA